MSLKFQTTKWDVEITWEQLTVTPLGTAGGQQYTNVDEAAENTQPGAANYFLFDLLGQLFGSERTQEQLSQ